MKLFCGVCGFGFLVGVIIYYCDWVVDVVDFCYEVGDCELELVELELISEVGGCEVVVFVEVE